MQNRIERISDRDYKKRMKIHAKKMVTYEDKLKAYEDDLVFFNEPRTVEEGDDKLITIGILNEPILPIMPTTPIRARVRKVKRGINRKR